MGWLSKLFNLEFISQQPAPIPVTETEKEDVKKPEGGDSKLDACNRLKLVLMHDRTQLSQTVLEQLRDELVEVISKYVEIDKSALELNLESESNTIALVANIPVLRSRAAAS